MGRDERDGAEEPAERLDVEWLIPAVLFGAARGVHAFGEGGVWRWTALGLAGLGVAASVAVIVAAVRRRAYGTLMAIAAAAVFVGAVAYGTGDLR
ncbi:hypothetical protein [Actinomadura litoris]|uniref:hypothetical protein n=1 Tax=Actinomadura litoris TaxID=2678616 RepID=UPI001FA6C690|nr:hypothetical protein [Actinomadura litoris]